MPLELEKVCLDLERVVRDTFPKDISLEVDVPTELWSLYGDPTQIHQVLMNLALNARDSMPDGGTIRLTVENRTIDTQYAAFMERARAGSYVQMTVADTGVGMSPDLLARVFDPFFTTKEVGKGTGLGLSSVDAIVRSHGGYLHVDSEERVGTSFQIFLPARPDGDEPPAMTTPSSGCLRQGNGELILVVDDESSVRTITRQTLEAFGYGVLTAPDGAVAVATYGQHKDRIALVLTDHSMPIMDGPSLIRALYGENPDVRIVVMSGLGLGDGVPRAEPGVHGFLSKPYTAETLVEMVQRVLSKDPSQVGGEKAPVR